VSHVLPKCFSLSPRNILGRIEAGLLSSSNSNSKRGEGSRPGSFLDLFELVQGLLGLQVELGLSVLELS